MEQFTMEHDEKMIDYRKDDCRDTIKLLKYDLGRLYDIYTEMFNSLDASLDVLLKAVDVEEELIDVPDELNYDVENLGLCSRTCNALIRHGINNVSDILNYPKDNFMFIRHFGKVSAMELMDKMHELGYEDFKIRRWWY